MHFLRSTFLAGLTGLGSLTAHADRIYSVYNNQPPGVNQSDFLITFRWDESYGREYFDVGAQYSGGNESLFANRYAPESLFDATAIYRGEVWTNVTVQEFIAVPIDFMGMEYETKLMLKVDANEGYFLFGFYFDDDNGFYFDPEMLVYEKPSGEMLEYSPGYFSWSHVTVSGNPGTKVPDSGGTAALLGAGMMAAALVRRLQSRRAISS